MLGMACRPVARSPDLPRRLTAGFTTQRHALADLRSSLGRGRETHAQHSCVCCGKASRAATPVELWGAAGVESRRVLVDLNRFRLIPSQLWQNSVNANGKDVSSTVRARSATGKELKEDHLKRFGSDWVVIE